VDIEDDYDLMREIGVLTAKLLNKRGQGGVEREEIVSLFRQAVCLRDMAAEKWRLANTEVESIHEKPVDLRAVRLYVAGRDKDVNVGNPHPCGGGDDDSSGKCLEVLEQMKNDAEGSDLLRKIRHAHQDLQTLNHDDEDGRSLATVALVDAVTQLKWLLRRDYSSSSSSNTLCSLTFPGACRTARLDELPKFRHGIEQLVTDSSQAYAQARLNSLKRTLEEAHSTYEYAEKKAIAVIQELEGDDVETVQMNATATPQTLSATGAAKKARYIQRVFQKSLEGGETVLPWVQQFYNTLHGDRAAIANAAREMSLGIQRLEGGGSHRHKIEGFRAVLGCKLGKAPSAEGTISDALRGGYHWDDAVRTTVHPHIYSVAVGDGTVVPSVKSSLFALSTSGALYGDYSNSVKQWVDYVVSTGGDNNLSGYDGVGDRVAAVEFQ